MAVFVVILIYFGLSALMYPQWAEWVNPHNPFYRHSKNASSWNGMMLFLLFLAPGMLVIAGIRRAFRAKQASSSQQAPSLITITDRTGVKREGVVTFTDGERDYAVDWDDANNRLVIAGLGGVTDAELGMFHYIGGRHRVTAHLQLADGSYERGTFCLARS